MYNSKELPLYKNLTNEEGLVADFLINHFQANRSVLDIGCGSGAISMKVKSSIPKLAIDGVELDISQLKYNNIFDKVYNIDFADFEFEKKYDYIILSHVLGHFDYNFRYNLCLKKILENNPSCEIFIITNAVVNSFKLIQEKIWEICSDETYYVDLNELLTEMSNNCEVIISPLNISLAHNNKKTFYKLLEIFSPIPLPNNIPSEISVIIDNSLIKNNLYFLDIPQFFIHINSNNIPADNLFTYKNHQELWEKIY